jgi:hypothetical protein
MRSAVLADIDAEAVALVMRSDCETHGRRQLGLAAAAENPFCRQLSLLVRLRMMQEVGPLALVGDQVSKSLAQIVG